ncbi:MAG TPA: DnaJ domain-containing protein [Alphaproteobacteria bacterium]|jgi:hypothetical protein
MAYILLAFPVFILVWLLTNWIANANPALLVKAVRWTLIVLVAVALGAIAWYGRYLLAAYVLPFLIPALIRWRLGGGGRPGGPNPGPGQQRPRPPGGMSRADAYAVLGLTPGADEAAIREAHRRLMARVHPDKGGSDYLAAQINRARDVLLGQ